MTQQIDYDMSATPHVAAYNRGQRSTAASAVVMAVKEFCFTYAKDEAACREVQGVSWMRTSWL